MTSSFWLALLLTFPYLMWEIWKFVSPALYENEKKNVRWVFLFGTIMFFIGCSVGYFLVFPMTLRFLATYELSAAITEQVSLDSYMDNFLMLIFVMGIVFEMPLVSWLLSQIGLLNRSFFHKYRRHAVVGLLVGAAFITPSSDPFTLSIVFLPLYGLYELSAFFVKKAPKEGEDYQTGPDIRHCHRSTLPSIDFEKWVHCTLCGSRAGHSEKCKFGVLSQGIFKIREVLQEK